jgi:hypothetical protein
MMHWAYGDESRDGTGKRVYAVSGVFGHESDWRAIESPWASRLHGRVKNPSGVKTVTIAVIELLCTAVTNNSLGKYLISVRREHLLSRVPVLRG